MPTKVP